MSYESNPTDLTMSSSSSSALSNNTVAQPSSPSTQDATAPTRPPQVAGKRSNVHTWTRAQRLTVYHLGQKYGNHGTAWPRSTTIFNEVFGLDLKPDHVRLQYSEHTRTKRSPSWRHIMRDLGTFSGRTEMASVRAEVRLVEDVLGLGYSEDEEDEEEREDTGAVKDDEDGAADEEDGEQDGEEEDSDDSDNDADGGDDLDSSRSPRYPKGNQSILGSLRNLQERDAEDAGIAEEIKEAIEANNAQESQEGANAATSTDLSSSTASYSGAHAQELGDMSLAHKEFRKIWKPCECTGWCTCPSSKHSVLDAEGRQTRTPKHLGTRVLDDPLGGPSWSDIRGSTLRGFGQRPRVGENQVDVRESVEDAGDQEL